MKGSRRCPRVSLRYTRGNSPRPRWGREVRGVGRYDTELGWTQH